jgi:hypothetical protein
MCRSALARDGVVSDNALVVDRPPSRASALLQKDVLHAADQVIGAGLNRVMSLCKR